MAERKAVNKYYPPDWKPEHGSLNKFHGQHALRERAKKLDQGILVIRFEVPFDFWCLGCNNHVAKGVRYNAEKKAVGSYYTTKIWEFSMKCHLCPQRIVWKTDPQACDYLIESGGRKKIESYSAESAESIEFMDKEEREKIQGDPMSKLEHTVEDKRRAAREAERLLALQDMNAGLRNDYELSKKARLAFRTEKKSRAAADVEATRAALGFKLLPASANDTEEAMDQLYRNPLQSARQTARVDRVRIASQPILGAVDSLRTKQQELLMLKARKNLRSGMLGSSEAGISSLKPPSSSTAHSSTSSSSKSKPTLTSLMPSVKLKRKADETFSDSSSQSSSHSSPSSLSSSSRAQTQDGSEPSIRNASSSASSTTANAQSQITDPASSSLSLLGYYDDDDADDS